MENKEKEEMEEKMWGEGKEIKEGEERRGRARRREMHASLLLDFNSSPTYRSRNLTAL